MSDSRVLACIGAILLGTAFGCGHGFEQPLPVDSVNPQALFDEWKALVDNPEANKDNNRYIELVHEMAAASPDILHKIVDVIADPSTKPESRVMAMGSLNGFVMTDMLPKLLKLTDPSMESSTRAGITILLSSVNTPECMERIRQLANDSDKRVKFAATVGLVSQGDADARKSAQALYFEPSLPPQYRERIAFTLAQVPQPEDVKVLAAATADSAFDPMTRAMAIGSLVTLGDPAAIPSLQQCVDSDAPPEVKDLARDALASLKSQQEAAASESAPPVGGVSAPA
ncbi:MAG: HEAT repeat domain-containing protein, partial [Candidatus Hydrogenedentales bacterium]